MGSCISLSTWYKPGLQWVMYCQVWSGSSDGTVAVTDLDAGFKMDSSLARSLKTPSGKGLPFPEHGVCSAC